MTVILVSRAAFAKQHCVSKAAVQKWEKRSLLVIVDGKINVEASDRKLMHAGAGRFSGRANRTPVAPVVADTPDAAWNGEVRTLQYEARILVAFVNRIAAHGGLTAWESGADLETAKKTDTLFRFLMMDAAAELLTDIATPAPDGFSWADAPIWSDEHMAQIDWTAVKANGREPANG